jgi:exopolysaccharide biosynthesis protein
LVLAVLLLSIFTYFHLLRPADLEQKAEVLPRPDTEIRFAGPFTDGTVEQTETSYRSAQISISIDTVQTSSTVYTVADIYVAELKYVQSAFAHDAFRRGEYETTAAIADRHQAILAINGDFCAANAGPVVRNGMLYRVESYQDILILDYDGQMRTLSAREYDPEQLRRQGAYQVWTFGPMLLADGQPLEHFNSTLFWQHPRTAIGYYEPGHYCFVVVDGRQPGYSAGSTLRDLALIFQRLGCQAAFNLDGGRSSEMIFLGRRITSPYKDGRPVSDIVMIKEAHDVP